MRPKDSDPGREFVSSQRLAEALQALRVAYGLPRLPGVPRRWPTLVDVVAGEPSPVSARPSGLDLSLPEEVAAGPIELIRDALRETGRETRRAAVLPSLARWWPEDPTDDAWWEAGKTRQRELRSIKGVGLELVDRILVFVVGQAVMPLSRAAQRIVVRHGWGGLEVEYEEWQHLYQQAGQVAGIDLRMATSLIQLVGREFCRTSPMCDGCPLECLLPAGGPYEPDDG